MVENQRTCPGARFSEGRAQDDRVQLPQTGGHEVSLDHQHLFTFCLSSGQHHAVHNGWGEESSGSCISSAARGDGESGQVGPATPPHRQGLLQHGHGEGQERAEGAHPGRN